MIYVGCPYCDGTGGKAASCPTHGTQIEFGTSGSIPWTANAPAKGCWVFYDYDQGPCISAVFDSEVAALRHAVDLGYGKVTFLPWGVRISDHLSPAKPSTPSQTTTEGDQA